jgi:branched-chain amino acid transport system permease protein
MTTFIQQILLGLRDGSLFSLVALGIVLVFKTTGVVNFAYGNMGMFSIYIAYSLLTYSGAPLWLAVAVAIVFAFFLGVAAERGLLRLVRHMSHSAMLILTLGILMILEGLSLQIWKQDYRSFPNLVSGVRIIRFLDGRIILRNQDILIFIVAAAIMIGLFMYFKFTKTGLAIRATASNERSAKLMGIKVGLVFAAAWGISTSLSAVAATLAAPRTLIYPNMMLALQIQGLTAAVLGGFDSLPGTVVGGLLLGVIQQLVGNYISDELRMAFALVIILILLMVKPSGLLGSKSVERV